jgi:hypothetical protein
MTDDENEAENYIENINRTAQNWVGEEMGPAEILNEFHLYGHQKRAAALDDRDRKMKSIDTMTDMRKISDLITLRGEMGEVHHRLRKAGR